MGIVHLKDLAKQHNIAATAMKKFEARLNELGIKPAYAVAQGKGVYSLYQEEEVTAKLKEWLDQRQPSKNGDVSYADVMERLTKLAAKLEAVANRQVMMLEAVNGLHAKLNAVLEEAGVTV